jgi:predicted N-acetyltransferase YhbS
MSSIVPVTDVESLARFCATGHALRPEVVTRQAADLSFLVKDASLVAAARCSLWWRHTPTYADHKVGFIGHYAAVDHRSGIELLQLACDRLAGAGCTLAVGPVDGNTWQRYRLLTKRGSEPVFFLEPDNPDEWPGHFTEAGFQSLANYHSALNCNLREAGSRIAEFTAKVASRGIAVRTLQANEFEAELPRVHALSLRSFQNNLLYSPIGLDDFLAQYLPIMPHLRGDLVFLAERGEELVGFLLGIPDLLQAQRGVPMDTVILKTMAVHPDHEGFGLGGLLMALCHQRAHAAGFTRVIHALFHEANRSGRLSAHSARVMRTYTLYARTLGAER